MGPATVPDGLAPPHSPVFWLGGESVMSVVSYDWQKMKDTLEGEIYDIVFGPTRS